MAQAADVSQTEPVATPATSCWQASGFTVPQADALSRRFPFLQTVTPLYEAGKAPTIMTALQEIPDMAPRVLDWSGQPLADLAALAARVGQEVQAARLAALDADVIGLLEVENNGYSTKGALAQLTAALNKGASKPYRFIITTEQPGSDAIKVALLYRPSSVNVEGKAAMLLAKPFDWGSRPPLAQSFRHLASNELVTVSINHFKSKGSCPKDAADVNAEQNDGQACWNTLRTQSAKALSDWLHSQPTGVTTDKQIILGDLNAYRMEAPLQYLEQNGWQHLAPKDAVHSSFVYRGRSGTLDHALASPQLKAKLQQFQHWGINADEPAVLDYNTEFKSKAQQQSLYAPDPFRSSDHDPVLIDFKF